MTGCSSYIWMIYNYRRVSVSASLVASGCRGSLTLGVPGYFGKYSRKWPKCVVSCMDNHTCRCWQHIMCDRSYLTSHLRDLPRADGKDCRLSPVNGHFLLGIISGYRSQRKPIYRLLPLQQQGSGLTASLSQCGISLSNCTRTLEVIGRTWSNINLEQ